MVTWQEIMKANNAQRSKFKPRPSSSTSTPPTPTLHKPSQSTPIQNPSPTTKREIEEEEEYDFPSSGDDNSASNPSPKLRYAPGSGGEDWELLVEAAEIKDDRDLLPETIHFINLPPQSERETMDGRKRSIWMRLRPMEKKPPSPENEEDRDYCKVMGLSGSSEEGEYKGKRDEKGNRDGVKDGRHMVDGGTERVYTWQEERGETNVEVVWHLCLGCRR
jgi:hypothetical protein